MIPLPSKPKVVQKSSDRAVFEIEGLYPGYGVTIGNSLRRVLLSSLEGAAVVSAKIKNAPHEFSTIDGVMEDVVMLLLNLKKLRFKLFTDEPQTATLAVKGEKEVKGKDFKLSSQTRLSNPDLHIATLTKSSAELNIEALIEKGVGYQSIEAQEERKKEVCVLPLDAMFSPVKKVSFSVENMRVGKRTDFDKLSIVVETDGAVSPEEAFGLGSDILLDHFVLISEAVSKSDEKLKRKGEKQKKDTEPSAVDDVKKTKIEVIDVSERAKTAIIAAGIKTVGGLAKKTEKDLSGLDGMGPKAIEEIKKALKKLGLELKT